jgi:hypothetical protein
MRTVSQKQKTNKMAITPTVSNHDDSPWYKIMEDKGKVWNKVAEEVGAKIKGVYNAYIVEFEMTQEVNSYELKINGKRELITLRYSSVFVEVLYLNLKAKDIDQSNFLKVSRGWISNFFFNLSGKYKYKTSVKNYRIGYNTASVLDKVVKTKIFEIADVDILTVGPEGLSLEIQEVPKDVKTARIIRDFWQVVL